MENPEKILGEVQGVHFYILLVLFILVPRERYDSPIAYVQSRSPRGAHFWLMLSCQRQGHI